MQLPIKPDIYFFKPIKWKVWVILTNVQIVSQRFQPIIKANNNLGIFFSQLMWIILESWSNSNGIFFKSQLNVNLSKDWRVNIDNNV